MADTYGNTIPFGKDMNAPAEKPPSVVTKGTDDADYKMASKLYAQGKQIRKQIDGDWDKWERWYTGKQWDSKRPSYKANPSMNILRPTIQTILPIMTDTAPSFDIMPMEPSDYSFADLINTLVDNWWQRRNMQVVLTYSILDCLIFPAGIMKVVWNDELDGVGDIECTRVDPRNIYVDADATDFTDAKYICEEKWMSVAELKVKFPDKADKIVGSKDTSNDPQNRSSSIYSGTVSLQSPTDQDVQIDSENTQSMGGSSVTSTKVVECWIRDETLEEIDAGENKKIIKKKYPRGKVVTILPDCKICLQVTDNPYGDGRFPYVRLIDSVLPGKFWGEGEISPLIETQKMLNKVGQTIIDWCNKMTNNVWILDDNSGVTPNMITNQIGLILTKRPGSEVRREPAPPMPAEVFNVYQMLMALADQQSGVHDVTSGRKPTGVTAAAAIQELQDAAQTRIRLKERNLQSSLVQMGYLIVSRMLQFYTSPRVVRITGQQGWPEFYEVYFSKTEYGDYVANKKTYEFAPATRQYTAVGDWSEVGKSKGEFDIEVQAGTSLPFMKQRRSQLAMGLYSANPPAIDQEALLKTVDFPDYQEVMRRMQGAAQAAAQAAPVQQGAVPQMGGAMPPPTPAEQQVPVIPLPGAA